MYYYVIDNINFHIANYEFSQCKMDPYFYKKVFKDKISYNFTKNENDFPNIKEYKCKS